MLKYLENNKKQDSRILYEQVFEDTNTFVDYYYKERIQDHKVLTYYHEEELVSMLHRIPHFMKLNNQIEDVDYIYAVSTKYEYRKRGIMGELMQTALRDMYEENILFTYLIPETPKVYYPYGFAFIYDRIQKLVVEEDLFAVSGHTLKSAQESDFEDLIQYSNEFLKKHKQVFLSRDYSYYLKGKRQLEVENGTIWLLYHGNVLEGYCFYSNENKIEISEFVCNHSKRELFLQLLFEKLNVKQLYVRGILNPWENCEEKEQIMARIVNVRSIHKYLTPLEEFEVAIKIKDSVIEQNNQVFVWRGSKEGCTLAPTIQEPQLTVSIEELTQWLFGYREIKDMPKVVRLQGVFINDIL